MAITGSRKKQLNKQAKKIVNKYRNGEYELKQSSYEIMKRWTNGEYISQVRKKLHDLDWIDNMIDKIYARGKTEYDPLLCVMIDKVLWLLDGNHTCMLAVKLLELKKKDSDLSFVEPPFMSIIDPADFVTDPAEVKFIMRCIGDIINDEQSSYVPRKPRENVKHQLEMMFQDGEDITDTDLHQILAENNSMQRYKVRDIAEGIISSFNKAEIRKQSANFRSWAHKEIDDVENFVVSYYSAKKWRPVSTTRVVLDWDRPKLAEGCGKAQWLAYRDGKHPFIVFHLKEPSDAARLPDYIKMIEANGSIRSPDKSWFDYVILAHDHKNINIFESEHVRVHINGEDYTPSKKKKQ